MAFIDIAGIGKRFGEFQALGGIDLAIEVREFITFLGPSGCGKTTLLRILAGFIAPDAGSITVDGQTLSAPGSVVPPEARRMGMVFQNYAVWPHMSVFANVAFGLRIAKLARNAIDERVRRVLSAVGLDGLEGRHPAQLSGGQQQRVALARSLVMEPAILLLDEPLSNLDAKLRERMRTELKDLQRRTGITFIYVTHDQAEAMALSDRIVVFNKGRAQQTGTPRDVYERPANLFVADFMGLVNKISGMAIPQSDGSVRMRVGDQMISARAAAGSSIAPGPAIVAIRPEAIRLGAAFAAPGMNILSGTVAESVFLGNIVDYRIDVGGTMLRVQGGRWENHAPGTAIQLSVPTSECLATDAPHGDQDD